MDKRRGKHCHYCLNGFWSGKKGVMSPIGHYWFCTQEHYKRWYEEQPKANRLQLDACKGGG